MRRLVRVALALGVGVLAPPVLAAPPMTLATTLDLVRKRGANVLASSTALAEARASRAGATPWLGHNPTVSGGTGFIVEPGQPPWRVDRVGPSALLEVSLPLEIAFQRSRRISAADAHVAAASDAREEAMRQALVGAGHAFFRALHARGQARLAEVASGLAEASHGAAKKRFEAGQITGLDVRLSELDVTSSHQALAVARAEYRHAMAELSALTGLPPRELGDVEGTFVRTDPLPTPEEALARANRRADVRALKAEAHAAWQDANVAAADKFPTPQLRANYQYWNTEHSVTTAIEVPLPVFVRGQGEEARARARANGLLDEAAAREQSLRAEVLAVLELARTLAQSRQQYATTGAAELRSLVEDAQRNYGERRIDMLTLLNVQRQALQAARDALDLSVREALARLWLDAAMGVLR